MNQLAFISYNNYYNRQVKYLNNYNAYVSASPIYQVVGQYDFDPGDGVSTKIIVNSSTYIPYCDYAIVCTASATLRYPIESRWFIMDCNRIRGGQYELTLRRDLIADSITDGLFEMPMFVEKGYVGYTDPAVFNDENMTFNQIKTSETLLKDGSKVSWIVGYMARNDGDSRKEYKVTAFPNSSADYQFNSTKHYEWEYFNSVSAFDYKQFTFKLYCKDSKCANINYTNEESVTIESPTSGQGTWDVNADSVSKNWFDFEAIASEISKANGYVLYDDVYKFNDKTIRFSDGYYKVTFTSTYVELNQNINSSTIPNAYDLIKQTMINNGQATTYCKYCVIYTSTSSSGNTGLIKLVPTFTFVGSTSTENITIPITRNSLSDVPYDMFCMPYLSDAKTGITCDINGFQFAALGTASLQAAQEFASQFSTFVYDIQILPYCPIVKDGLFSNDTIDLSKLTYKTDYIYSSNRNFLMLFPSTSTFTFDINLTSPISVPTDSVELKVASQTELYRLCSPNYNGLFEFNPYKNNGFTKVNVDCTYKPYNPYIHVNPNFGNLYGSDFNDARGLICGGDFSMAIVNDQWKTFELNNKNYQASFDRQIQSLELSNKWQSRMDISTAVTGTITAAASGAASGAMIGGLPGAIGGAALGGIASAAGGIMDIVANNELRQDQEDAMKDQFGYQLGNIKALPESLSKTSSYNANNKYFPFIEKYTCTDTEKQALRDKITYNGMTIMRIGTINTFSDSDERYIKGKLIRYTGHNDRHFVNELNRELEQGIYYAR